MLITNSFTNFALCIGALSATTVTVQLDRQVPNFSSMGYSGNSNIVFYPSGMTVIYDSVTPEPYWATNVFNFETNCDVSQSDVKVWNMNIPWTESPAGVFNNTNQDFNLYSGRTYVGTKEYLGYKTNSSDSSVHIGKPLPNTETYLLDTMYGLVPYGSIGEICIGGVGLARGYLNRPELTKEKFIDNPYKLVDRL